MSAMASELASELLRRDRAFYYLFSGAVITSEKIMEKMIQLWVVWVVRVVPE